MGLRIHKVMGWALTDVRYDRAAWAFTDERINLESPLLGCRLGSGAIDAYARWLRARDGDDAVGASFTMCATLQDARSRNRTIPLDRVVVHEPETGSPKVLVVTPPWAHDWCRWDDPIDYQVETSRRRPGVGPRVQVLRYAPFPFDGLYMDADSGERFEPAQNGSVFAQCRAAVREHGLDGTSVAELDAIARTLLAIPTWQEACRRVVPAVPDDVAALVEWGHLFTDPAVVRQMRPVIYTYWA